MIFNPRNPATWTAREERNAAGTLLCICGKAGQEFYVDGSELIGAFEFGILRGACCDAHWALYRRHTRPEDYPEGELELEIEVPAPALEEYETPPLFGLMEEK